MKNGSSESRAVKIHDESLAPSMLRETPFWISSWTVSYTHLTLPTTPYV
jgi:hypothetical protein